MNTYADQKTEKKSPLTANNFSQKKEDDRSSFQFVDNRPQTVAQRKLQDLANNSPKVKQMKAYQEAANNGGAKQLRSFQSSIDKPVSEPVQGKFEPLQKKANKTGLPDNLKAGVENLSGLSMHDVKVHYNSGKPAQLQALAFARGTDIHVGPGQEKHLPHEAWHVVQQKQGRVKPTIQLKGNLQINDYKGLEKEADKMASGLVRNNKRDVSEAREISAGIPVLQRVVTIGTKDAGEKTYSGQQGYDDLIKLVGKLSLKQANLLKTWVTSRGGLGIGSVRVSSGVERNYPDIAELVTALKGEVASRKNLEKETTLGKDIPEIKGLKAKLNSVTIKIFRHIEQELGNKDSNLSKGGKKKEEFWQAASKSYRGLWNFIGTRYNLKYYTKLIAAGGLGAAMTPYFARLLGTSSLITGPSLGAVMMPLLPTSPLNTFKSTLSAPKGNIEEIFASIKQVSNVYNDRIGKNKFKTPKLKVDLKGKVIADNTVYEESGEKRYNTQSLKEKELWTRYARQHNIPISAGASGSMDRIYRLAKNAGADDKELIALALSGHHIFNQRYVNYSNDPHTFHEIMDTLRPYLQGTTPFTKEVKEGTYNDHLRNIKKGSTEL